MPYFVYQITPARRLTHVQTTERYQEACASVRRLREARTPDDEVEDLDLWPRLARQGRYCYTPTCCQHKRAASISAATVSGCPPTCGP